MFRLPILPAELRIPLDRLTTTVEVPADDGAPSTREIVTGEFPGVVAVVRPLGLEEESQWHDAFPGADHRSQAATSLVFQQLVRIDGLEMATPDGGAGPFDPTNADHRRSLPMAIRSAIYLALVSRAAVGAVLEKNSDSPSGSDGTSDTASSSADGAASASATS